MYIPLMKCREAELRTAKSTYTVFSDDIVPLFEIINDFFETRYEVNPVTNEYVYEKKNGRNYKKKLKPTEDDINTLEIIKKTVKDKKAFIDYLRVDNNKYKNYDVAKVSLGLKLRDFDEYKKRVCEIANYENFIPVISISNAFDNALADIITFYKQLKELSNNVAIRITADIISEYMPLLISLRTSDYLLFDVGETNIDGLSIEIEEINENTISAQKVILNSPRAANYQNKDFEETGITALIDNSLLKKYKDLGFDGFGDYAGYKDVLPSLGLPNRGAALCLIYNYKDNGFWVFTNKDTSLGVKGYKELKPKVLAMRPRLDPNNSCPAYMKIDLPGDGNYTSWIEVCLIRYITQLYNNIADWK